MVHFVQKSVGEAHAFGKLRPTAVNIPLVSDAVIFPQKYSVGPKITRTEKM